MASSTQIPTAIAGAALRGVRARLNTARAVWRQGGLAGLVVRASDRWLPAGNSVAYWDRFVIVELDPRARQAAPLAMQATQASGWDLEELCQRFGRQAERYRRRAREGQRCLVVRQEHGLVAQCWLIDDRRVFDTNSGLPWIPAVRPAVWWHDVWVDPAWRGRGCFGALVHEALQTVGESSRLYAEIHFLNERSLRAHHRAGFRIIRRVTVASCLARKWYVVEDQAGNRHIERRSSWRVPHI